MKKNRILIIISSLCLMALIGCNTQKGTEIFPSKEKDYHTEANADQDKINLGQTEKNTEALPEGYDNAEQMFNAADLSGSVIEFNDLGCRITKLIQEGENLAYEAAEGNETPENTAEIIYGEDTIFQLALVDYSTERLVSLDDSTKSEVLKQSKMLFRGEYESDGRFRATNVIIVRNA